MVLAVAHSEAAPLLELRGIAKRFGGVAALRQVSFDLRAGEIHALLGENGAGKSTLIKILGGIHRADAGEIRIEGRPVAVDDVAAADRLGIRIIHQELSLVPNLSVAENIYLGREPRVAGLIDRQAMRRDARALVERLGLHEIRAVETPVAALSVAHRQLVEIARALAVDARILVLDEPTSSLSEAETEALFVTLRRLRARGVGIIYISHRLEEIVRLADRVTVLRDGQAVGTRTMGALDQQELVRWMVGREVRDYFHRPPYRPGTVALEVSNLRNSRVHDVSFVLHEGEVLGIAGLVGSGRTELARALFGIDPVDGGRVAIGGRPVTIRCPQDALHAGMALVPEDRQGQGLVMIQTVAFNLALPWVREWNPPGWPRWRVRQRIVQRAIQSFGIKVSDPEQPVSGLSGGNQQKVLVSRWMERRPRVLILDEPTRGVDVGAREEMFRLLSGLVREGMAVLLISSDLNEVLNVSHRVAVYRDGRMVATFPSEATNMEEIMTLLTGAQTS